MSIHLHRLAAIIVLALAWILAPPTIQATPEKERTLSFYHIHTKDSLTVTFKKNGRYDQDALKKINWFLRDWRNDAVKAIDPRTIDIIWEMHTELGSQKPVHIISAYRSRQTNDMLRRTRGGQAQNSYHITGKAVDIHFPDVPVRFVRYAALIRQRGGVGYYPTSALPFVHVDSGRVRHWPRMNVYEMAQLFPNGFSKHIPSTGRRLRPSDLTRAKAQRKDLVKHLAAYHELRTRPKTATVIAAAGDIIKPPKPVPAVPPAIPDWKITVIADAKPRPRIVAPVEAPADIQADTRNVTLTSIEKPPQLQNERPKVAFSPSPSQADRARLERLFAEASFVPLAEPPKLIRSAGLAPGRRIASLGSLLDGGKTRRTEMIAALRSVSEDGPKPSVAESGKMNPPTEDDASASRFDWHADRLVAVVDDGAWTGAPEYDDDHPDELAYRPFPIEPLMSNSPNDPSLAVIERVEHRKTLAFLSDEQLAAPMQLRPSKQVAQLMWRQEFSGTAVQIFEDRSALNDEAGLPGVPRAVKTTRE